MELIINPINKDSLRELENALGFVKPDAILRDKKNDSGVLVSTVIADGVPVSFEGVWKSRQFTSPTDLDIIADAIEFANPAAVVRFTHDCITVTCDPTVKNPITKVIVMGRHPLELPEGFTSAGTQDIQFSNDPKEASIAFYGLLDTCVEMGVGLLMQNVPSVLAGAIAWMHNRAENPRVFATLNGNRAPLGSPPSFQLVGIYEIATNTMVWQA